MVQTERYVESYDGTRLFTRSIGEGTPLILCDGVGCDGFIWRYIWEKFAGDFKIIHFNYRSHGLSDQAHIADALKVTDMRADLEAVMDAYGVDKALIMGHSMGVQVILDYALQHPERVLGLVPICGSYGRPLETFHDTNLASKIIPRVHKLSRFFPNRFQQVWSRVSQWELTYRIATTAEVNGKVIERDDFVPYFKHLSQMDVDVFLRAVQFMNEHSTEEQLNEIQLPTLIVAGQYDTFTPCWLSLRMQRLIANSELMVIPGGTHIAPLEIPELLELRLARFVEERIKPLLAPAPPVKKKRARATKKKTVAKKAAESSLDASSRSETRV
jgi:pimeloyl-ACP methyl ester carboxylesterase